MKARLSRRGFLGAAAITAAALASRTMARAERPQLHFALSMETLTSNNLNDARAAYRVWSDQIFNKMGERRIEILPQIFYPSQQLTQMLHSGQVDCATLTAWEYAKSLDLLQTDQAVVEDYTQDGLDYVLLVPASSPYQKLEDLKKCRMLLHQHRDTALLRAWLALQLAALRQPNPEQFFDTVEQHEKINEILLPLFFHKVQVVGLCRRSFAMATELNPQLGRELRMLANSPRVVPLGIWFRKGCDEGNKQELLQLLMNFRNVPAARQIMTLYEFGGFVRRPGAIMNTTVEMMRQYERLRRI